ncbi:MAG: hypothetical protein JETCAE02_17970 [Anaerolineaceae bacterium]|nr:hypothetical protein [Anaerolineales bacterium]MCC7511443.1 PqqD family protein [Anaerolineae bacterium]GIK08365.1 MAG: hypothetical protein BroJett001_04310 [Chloroflexota bacterium]GJQ39385.1 MAG: hypothetical protein JETCAE02_17970 [Anaerolineaceae bacterium]WKZ50150.1 MAG: PqqD family protein [Anaerolineales bacterium]
MLTLDADLKIPEGVLSASLDDEAVLLDTRANQYFSLTEVGARFWQLLSEGKSLRGAFDLLLTEYEVDAPQLERDLLELADRLTENGLVEVASA